MRCWTNALCDELCFQMLWTNRFCPTAEKLYREVQTLAELRALEGENAGFLSMLTEKTGKDRALRLGDIWEIFDTLSAEVWSIIFLLSTRIRHVVDASDLSP